MKLYLVRHGEAAVNIEGGEPALSRWGNYEVEKTGTELANRVEHLDKIFHSGKLRAQQTAEIIRAKIEAKIQLEKIDGLKPNDSAAEIAEWVNGVHKDIMLVGHLPFMAKLVALLLKDSAEKTSLSFGSACVACLERSGSGDWTLLWFFSPQ